MEKGIIYRSLKKHTNFKSILLTSYASPYVTLWINCFPIIATILRSLHPLLIRWYIFNLHFPSMWYPLKPQIYAMIQNDLRHSGVVFWYPYPLFGYRRLSHNHSVIPIYVYDKQILFKIVSKVDQIFDRDKSSDSMEV